MKNLNLFRILIAIAVLWFNSQASGQLVPSQEPVLNRQANVRPNVTLILDNSNSMALSCVYSSNLQNALHTMRGGVSVEGSNADCLTPVRPWENPALWPTYTARTSTNVVNVAQVSPITNNLMYDPTKRYLPGYSNTGTVLGSASVASFVTLSFYLPRPPFDPLAVSTFATINDTTRYDLYRVRPGSTAFSKNTSTFSGTNPITKSSDRTDCVVEATYCTAAEEQQNIANWRTYHFNRLAVAKVGIGKAFADQTDNFRLNWTKLANHQTTDTNCTAINQLCTYYPVSIPAIRNYADAKTPFFTWLNSFNYTLTTTYADPGAASGQSAGTPLRITLDMVGQDYERSDNAGPWAHTPWSPGTEAATAHLSCRRSFALLTTDGVWNDRKTPTSVVNIDVDGIDGPTIAHSSGNPALAYTYRPRDSDARSRGKADRATTSGGNPHTLADVALHYWRRDLRAGVTGLANNASPGGASSPPFWQNLTTYSIGLGVYPTLTDSQLELARAGSLNWPTPSREFRENVDDLVHAAHNGGGEYLTVRNATEFAEKLGATVSSIAGQQFSQAGVAASAVTLTSGTKKFVPYYTSGTWWGNVRMINLRANGDEDSVAWQVIDTGSNGEPTGTSRFPLPSARNIVVWKNSTDKAISFDSNILLPASPLRPLLNASVNADMIDFLRGSRSKEGDNQPFRERAAILGDIVNSTPVFVKNNTDFQYNLLPSTNPGLSSYATYMASKASRTEGVLFVGANDGMLHAFREGVSTATGGVETFAYVPQSVLGNLHLLASKSYSHRFFVDGPLTEADAYVQPGGSGATAWTNVLLGTTGAGAKTVFALNVTDPLSLTGSKVMWEVSNTTTGYGSLGHVLTPVQHGILRDGTWAAIFGNGYDSAGGRASLFIANLATGALIKQIPTDSASSNGLGGVRLVQNANKEIIGAYAGDLQGRVWKFDLSATASTSWGLGNGGTALFTAVGPTGVRQPITAQPAVIQRSDVSAYDPSYMVVVGSGKLFASTDPADTTEQSAYGLWDRRAFGVSTSDPIASTTSLVLINVTSTGIITTTFTSADGVNISEATRLYNTIASRTVDWTVDRGWRLPYKIVSGQRTVYPAEPLGQVIRLDTVAPRLSPNSCEASASDGYNLLVSPLTGTCKAETTLDTNGDGVIDESDASSCIYSTTADGQDVVLRYPPESDLGRTGDRADIQDSLGHMSVRAGCFDPNSCSCAAFAAANSSICSPSSSSPTAPPRAWRRLFLR